MGRRKDYFFCWIAGIVLATCGCRHVPVRPAVHSVAASAPPAATDQVVPNPPVRLVQHEMAEPSEAVSLPPSEPVANAQPVEHFVSIALANHPKILSARARVAAARQRVPQAEALEDPLLSNSFYPISDQALQTAAGRAGNTLSVSQKYPWPEKRWTKGAIACREMQIAASVLDQTELEIEESVRLAYYELWFAQQAIDITERNREIAAELITLAKARNAAGGSQQDVLRAELQVDNIDDKLIQLRRQKALAQADLAALIQQPADTRIEAVGELAAATAPEQLDALFSAAGECSPELRELRWAVSRDREKQKLACLNRRPDFVLGAGWQTITESAAISPVANGHDNVNFMVGVTLPIWRDKIDASIREASAEVTASSRAYHAARDDTYRNIRRLTEQAYAAEEQLRLYKERVLPRAKRALQISSADYRGRLVDFGEVTDGFTEVLMIELQVARAEATLAGVVAQLHRAVGCEVAVPNPE